MLNPNLITKEIQLHSEGIFKETRSLKWFTKQSWKKITTNSRFLELIKQKHSEHNLAQWQGNLNHIQQISEQIEHYQVLAVDGSQIYPDHHLQGIECFLINTGTCFLSYQDSGKANLSSSPKIFLPKHCAHLSNSLGFSSDLVDLIREQLELETLVEHATNLVQQAKATHPLICLFDGNLLFWHLENKPSDIKTFFLNSYISSLQQLYQLRIPHAGYLSGTRFHDIVQLFQIGLDGIKNPTTDDFNPKNISSLKKNLETLTDAELLTNVLEPFEKTTTFENNSKIASKYPKHLKPCFFYLHTGNEIVRIEIPYWITQESSTIETICMACINQCHKGCGYPVSLAEAHNQAVVTGADRNLFYHLIYALGVRYNKQIGFSQKSLKKKILGI